MEFTIESESELFTIAQNLLKYANTQKVFAFYGEMGVGKTTLITQLCTSLGVLGHVTSPTFSIVNEYQTAKDIIYHFDFYRLKNQNEALDIGVEEYLYSGAYCFIEWPEKVPDLLPQNYLKIELEVLENNARKLRVEEFFGNQ